MDQNEHGEPRRYVVLTQEILGATDINAQDKLLLAYISSFEQYYASNASAAEFLGLTERTVERSKQKLTKLGYIDLIKNTGRGCIYAFRLTRLAKNGGADSPKLANQTSQNWRTENKVEIKVENNIDKSMLGAEAQEHEQKETYGRDDINELADLWQKETGIEIKHDKTERRQLYNLIRKYGSERTKALIKALGDIKRNGDRFAPQIATPRELTGKYSKLGRLELWMNRKSVSRPFGDREPEPAPANALPPRSLPDYGGAFEIQPDAEREAVSRAFAEARKNLPFIKGERKDD